MIDARPARRGPRMKVLAVHSDSANAFLGGFPAWEAPAALQPAGRRVAPSAAAASRKTKGA
jgi:hypothetical protein